MAKDSGNGGEVRTARRWAGFEHEVLARERARAYLPRRNAASIMHTRGGDVN